MQRRIVSFVVLLAFLLTGVIGPVAFALAQEVILLPQPGTRVNLSPGFAPALLKGLKIYPNDPFRLDFILDKGDTDGSVDKLKDASSRLIRYFLASITVPEKDLWVNLSPYEKDRIAPDAFGQTEMGRDLLAQDYILKQITASLIYPEGEAGKKFWAKVYAEAQARYGTTDIPVDTFNKVWIVPEKAVVYETLNAAYVVESRLKVMLESDYVAVEKSSRASVPLLPAPAATWGETERGGDIAKNILREVIIPILEKEVNEGQNFTQLRQVYNSLILAIWFKDRIRESILGKAYVDRDKIAGIDIKDKAEKDKIWARYVESFKKGAYNFIREEKDAASGEMVPKKHFSGGAGLNHIRDEGVYSTRRGRLESSSRIHPSDMLVVLELSPSIPYGLMASTGYLPDGHDNAMFVDLDHNNATTPALMPDISPLEATQMKKEELLGDGDWEFLKSRGVNDRMFKIAMGRIERNTHLIFGLKRTLGQAVNVDQFELIRKDFEKIITQKSAKDRRFVIYQFGLGKKFLETDDIFNALHAAFEAKGIYGEEQRKWAVSLISVDVNSETIRKFLETYKVRTPFVLDLKAVHADTLNGEAMRRLSGKYPKADIIFNRHTTYANYFAAIGSYHLKSCEKMDDLLKLSMILTVYVSTRNLLQYFAQPGTRYVIEPAQDIYGRVVHFPGTRISGMGEYADKKVLAPGIHDADSGVYIIDRPEALADGGFEYFLRNAATGDIVSAGNIQKEDLPQVAITDNGGIDLTRGRMNVDINTHGPGVHYAFDPAMIQRLEDATGMTPTIIDIRQMGVPLDAFMGSQEGPGMKHPGM